MKVEVLGSGCKKCVATAERITEVGQALNAEVTVEKVTDAEKIMRYQVMSTPGVAIDGKLVHSGSVPSREDIEGWLKGAA
ncbi:thioredoxin family protein [Ectothiorhodospiraceae bacterium WFHF3C12]|nr:thioredoxin family protein [Ectothiorhodospiraceae bacterium WFHF3C12]